MAKNVEREEVEKVTTYEECSLKVCLRRSSGSFTDEKDREVEYTTYYLVLDDDVRIKISLDPEKKSLIGKFVPFVPVSEDKEVE